MQNHGKEFSINGNIQSKTSKIHERVVLCYRNASVTKTHFSLAPALMAQVDWRLAPGRFKEACVIML